MSSMPRQSQNKVDGLTLVEMLVVMSTTALLLGALLPSLRAARAQTRRTVCLSNLRQMAVAAQNYAQLNDEYYPPAYLTERVDGVQYYRAWDFTSWRVWNGPTAVRHVKPGLLWMGLTILCGLIFLVIGIGYAIGKVALPMRSAS